MRPEPASTKPQSFPAAIALLDALGNRWSDTKAELDNLLPMLHMSEKLNADLAKEFAHCRAERTHLEDRVADQADTIDQLRQQVVDLTCAGTSLRNELGYWTATAETLRTQLHQERQA